MNWNSSCQCARNRRGPKWTNISVCVHIEHVYFLVVWKLCSFSKYSYGVLPLYGIRSVRYSILVYFPRAQTLFLLCVADNACVLCSILHSYDNVLLFREVEIFGKMISINGSHGNI